MEGVGVTLLPGDILLWRILPSSPWKDRLIGWGERKTKQINCDKVNYYHTAMVGPDYRHLYDSRPGGVNNRLVEDSATPDMEVYRMIEPFTDDELNAMWTYANSQKGVGYNWIGVLTVGMIEVWGKPFCSELVWRMATYAGRVLCPWETCLSPDDIAASLLIKRV